MRDHLLLGSIALLAGATTAVAGPINFSTALTVGKGVYINREQVIIRSFENDSTAANRDLQVSSLVSILGYGVNSRLALFVAVPLVEKKLSLTSMGDRFNRASRGLGDIKLSGRYTLHQDDSKSRTFRIAGFGGIKLPTGDDGKADGLGRLPIPLQSGSGSRDYFYGLVATWSGLQFQVDAQLAFQNNGSANDFAAGNQRRADISFQYRLLPKQLEADTPGFLYGVLEAGIIDQDHNKVAGLPDVNSGGRMVYLAPGIQYAAKKFVLEASLQVPVSNHLNGTALATDNVLSFGYRIHF